MIGDIILWIRKVKREMFCIHEYEWRAPTAEERKREGNEWTISMRFCKKCGRH